jgi:hypothetical protein
MHTMIIKAEKSVGLELCFDVVNIPISHNLTINEYTQGGKEIENVDVHYRLCNDFIEHLWALICNNKLR